MATYRDGNVHRATPNTVAAMRRGAESRRCPNCNRKSAMGAEQRTDDGWMCTRERTCRWCGFSAGTVAIYADDGHITTKRVKIWPDGRREEETW